MSNIVGIISKSIKEAIDGNFESLIIDHKQSGKFIQFAFFYEYDPGFIIDIPVQECNEKEWDTIQNMLPDRSFTMKNEIIAATQSFDIVHVEQASELGYKILKDVFNIGDEPELTTEMF